MRVLSKFIVRLVIEVALAIYLKIFARKSG